MLLDPASLEWEAINDGVMGGESQSRALTGSGSLRFEGLLSLENNGGFASIRARLPRPVIGLEKVSLAVTGDKRRFQFRLRESGDSRGIAWRAHFEAGPGFRTVELPVADFEPVFRGEPVIGARPLTDCELLHVGFMLADRAPGPFTLQIHAIDITFGEGKYG